MTHNLASALGVGDFSFFLRDFTRQVIILQMGIIPLNGPAAGGIIPGGGQSQGRVFRKGEYRLHQSLAPRRFTHHQAAIIILHRSTDNLRGGSAAAVDQNHQRQIFVLAVAVGEKILAVIFPAAFYGNNFRPFFKKNIRHLQGLDKGAAAVAAKIQYQLFHALPGQLLQLVHELPGGGLRKITDEDIPDVILENEGVRNAVKRNFFPAYSQVKGIHALPLDGDGHF